MEDCKLSQGQLLLTALINTQFRSPLSAESHLLLSFHGDRSSSATGLHGKAWSLLPSPRRALADCRSSGISGTHL